MCCSHQNDSSPITQGNSKADQAARQAAKSSDQYPLLLATTTHIKEENTILPKETLFTYLHSIFHTNPQTLKTFLHSFSTLTPEDTHFLYQLTSTCKICQRTNPPTPLKPETFPTHQAQEHIPGADWQLDFTNMPKVKKYLYLLILVDAFTGWVEAFPTTNKRATTVANILVTEIIPRFGIPTSFQSDNGPEFISQVTQKITGALMSLGTYTSHITPSHLERLSAQITH